jgi:hypothetical protein
MTLATPHLTPHVEWEAIDFPLVLTELEFEHMDLTLTNKLPSKYGETKTCNFMLI